MRQAATSYILLSWLPTVGHHSPSQNAADDVISSITTCCWLLAKTATGFCGTHTYRPAGHGSMCAIALFYTHKQYIRYDKRTKRINKSDTNETECREIINVKINLPISFHLRLVIFIAQTFPKTPDIRATFQLSILELRSSLLSIPPRQQKKIMIFHLLKS